VFSYLDNTVTVTDSEIRGLVEQSLDRRQQRSTHHIGVQVLAHGTERIQGSFVTRRPVCIQATDQQWNDVISDVIDARFAKDHPHVLQQVRLRLT